MTTTETRPTRPAAVAVDEACAICGEDAHNAFCHIYREDGSAISLCSPACAELFLHRPDHGPTADTGWFATSAAADTS